MKIERLDVLGPSGGLYRLYPPGALLKIGPTVVEVFRAKNRGAGRWTLWVKRR